MWAVVFHLEDTPLSLGCQFCCWEVSCRSGCHSFFAFCLFPLATFLLFDFGIFGLTTVYLGVDFFLDYFCVYCMLCIYRFITSISGGKFSAIYFEYCLFPILSSLPLTFHVISLQTPCRKHSFSPFFFFLNHSLYITFSFFVYSG